MSTDTDAYLFYGVFLPAGYRVPWFPEDADESGESDVEEWYARTQGLGEPDCREDALFQARLAKKQELVARMPVRIGTHCSDHYPMYYIAAKGTVRWCWRGSPAHIPNLGLLPASAPDVVEFCKEYLGEEVVAYDPDKHKDDKNFKLGWWMASYWGV